MIKSDSIKELAAALVQFQAELEPVKFNKVNKFWGNKYADLGAIIDAIRPKLAAYGLAIVQNAVSEGDKIGVETLIIHKSGEYLGNLFTLEAGTEKGKSAAQVAGSIITYARRYALAAALGLYSDEDTDGNAPPTNYHRQKQTQPKAGQGLSLEAAKAVVNSKGVPYDEIESERLAAMSLNIDKAIKNNGHDQAKKADLERKLEAIGVILQARAAKA